MPIKHGRSRPKPTSISRLPAVRRIRELVLLGPPLLIGREEEDAYDELCARTCAAVRPVDVIEEMFVADVVSAHWEIMELRRLRATLIKSASYEALKGILLESLEYGMIEKEYKRMLEHALDEDVREQDADGIAPKRLARQCVRDEPGAAGKVNELFKNAGRDTYSIYYQARNSKSEKLARSCVEGEHNAIKEVNKVLAPRGLSIHDVIDEPILEKLDVIDRINRLIIAAETLRNGCLRDLERRRARLGEALRRTLEGEGTAVKVIEQTTSL